MEPINESEMVLNLEGGFEVSSQKSFVLDINDR